MRLSPINNNQSHTNTNFRAHFHRKEITNMIKEVAAKNDPEGLPILYTLLKFVEKEIYGGVAELKQGAVITNRNYPENVIFLITDNARRQGHSERKSLVGALMDMCVKRDMSTAHSEFVRMPNRIFEDECWANRHVTEQDILDLSYKTPVKI